jgi:hypothetical protein
MCFGHFPVAEIASQLKTTIQMACSKVRHGDIAGEDGANTRAVTALDGNEFRTGLVRLRSKGVQGSRKRDRNGRKQYERSFHQFKVLSIRRTNIRKPRNK